MARTAGSADTEVIGGHVRVLEDGDNDEAWDVDQEAIRRDDPDSEVADELGGSDLADESADTPTVTGRRRKQSKARARRVKRKKWSPGRQAFVVGALAVIALSGLVGWRSYQTVQSHAVQQQRQLFLQAGRQGAINLTSIDYHAADADVARVLGSTTGMLHDDFQRRSGQFVQLVQKIQATTVGTVVEAGLESAEADRAQVLVIMQVKRTVGANTEQPIGWRMRVDVQRVGNDVKLSNVQFVP